MNKTKKVLYKNQVIIENLKEANTFFTRLKGLLGKKKLPECEGLLIYPCSQVHTFGMKFNIDVVFLSSDFVILEILHKFEPGKISKFVSDSKYVLEMAEGSANNYNMLKDENLKILE